MNSERLRRDLESVAAFGRDETGGWTRPAFGEADCRANAWFAEVSAEAGLKVRLDAFGNVIARLEGAAGVPALLIGSHLDTVTNGGLWDGALGVLAGLEVARRIKERDEAARAPIEIIAFRDEEGRFGAFSGSRCMMGQLPLDQIDRMRAADGEVLGEAMRKAGFRPEEAGSASRDPVEIGAYLELHIEQGPVLENAGCSIGIADAIAGQERMSIRFTGVPDHAGTTPMDLRRDAFAAAARFSDRFRTLILDEGGATMRGTIGIVKLTPNLGNVVPSDVRLGLEIRDIHLERLALIARRISELAREAARFANVNHQMRNVYRAAPVPMNGAIVDILCAAAKDLGHAAVTLPSGAGHDAAIMGALVPSGLLFVPSVGGRSHCPEEHTEWPDVEAGVAVLEQAARRVSVWLAGSRLKRPDVE